MQRLTEDDGSCICYCECRGPERCNRTISVVPSVWEDIMERSDIVIIAGCPNGPPKSSTLVDNASGHSLFRRKHRRK